MVESSNQEHCQGWRDKAGKLCTHSKKLQSLGDINKTKGILEIHNAAALFHHTELLWTLRLRSEQDSNNLDRLPRKNVGSVTYRIAYMALYLENRQSGIALFHALSRTPEIDPHFVHFVSSDWFRERHLNCFVLQVEPTRHMNKDQVIVGLMEAQYIQRIRDLFFTRITELIENQRGEWHKGLYNN